MTRNREDQKKQQNCQGRSTTKEKDKTNGAVETPDHTSDKLNMPFQSWGIVSLTLYRKAELIQKKVTRKGYE